MMNTNKTNLCPSCQHNRSCVLTSHKESVWSCSEYDEHKEVEELIDHFIETQKVLPAKVALA